MDFREAFFKRQHKKESHKIHDQLIHNFLPVDCEAHWKMVSQVLTSSMLGLWSVWAYVLMVFMKLDSPIWWDFNFYKTTQQCASDTVTHVL